MEIADEEGAGEPRGKEREEQEARGPGMVLQAVSGGGVAVAVGHEGSGGGRKRIPWIDPQGARV